MLIPVKLKSLRIYGKTEEDAELDALFDRLGINPPDANGPDVETVYLDWYLNSVLLVNKLVGLGVLNNEISLIFYNGYVISLEYSNATYTMLKQVVNNANHTEIP